MSINRETLPNLSPSSNPMDVGVDIVEIHRIAKQIHNPRFLKRVFTSQEVAYCRARKNAAQHFAVRFAAKEAVWKAVGERKLLHRDIQVRNRPNGKPEVVFPKRFSKLAKCVSISLSHGRDYAVAMALFR
jgi:holo-[acyl-carrier protein] synthase